MVCVGKVWFAGGKWCVQDSIGSYPSTVLVILPSLKLAFGGGLDDLTISSLW